MEVEPIDGVLVKPTSELLAWLTGAPNRTQQRPRGPTRERRRLDETCSRYVAKIPPAVQGSNSSGQLMAALRQVYDPVRPRRQAIPTDR